MSKKKVLTCFLLLAIAFTFMACPGRDRTGRNDGRTRIRVVHWDLTTMVYITALVDAFKEAHPEIAVEIIDIPSADYTQRLQIMLNGGSDFDVFWIKDGDTTKGLADRGHLADLSAFIEDDNIRLQDFHGVAERFIMNDKIVALPASTGFWVLYYNKDIFDRAGIPYPSNDLTWPEWEELAGRLTSGTGQNKIFGGLLHTWQACVQNWAVQDGRNTIIANDYYFFRPYYEMALRMQRAGYIWDYGVLRAGGIHYTSLFLQGNIATMPMGTWFFTTIIDRIDRGETNIRWGMATLPRPPDVEPGWTVGSVTPIAINNASRNKEASWEFVRFITSDEGAKIYASFGQFPGRATPETMEMVAALPGMPEGSAEALIVRNIALDRPMELRVAEINQMLGEEHALIMLEEVTIERGLENMARRSREIQSR
ncbi:MAG: sugar ABC transporter substrate-binding protein [Treponema sp.]|nr:sugar ABC transporter substrate-binding protein [Treponema sp.]